MSTIWKVILWTMFAFNLIDCVGDYFGVPSQTHFVAHMHSDLAVLAYVAIKLGRKA